MDFLSLLGKVSVVWIHRWVEIFVLFKRMCPFFRNLFPSISRVEPYRFKARVIHYALYSSNKLLLVYILLRFIRNCVIEDDKFVVGNQRCPFGKTR